MSKQYKLKLNLPQSLKNADQRVLEGTEIVVTRDRGYVGPLTDAELKIAENDPYVIVESVARKVSSADESNSDDESKEQQKRGSGKQKGSKKNGKKDEAKTEEATDSEVETADKEEAPVDGDEKGAQGGDESKEQ